MVSTGPRSERTRVHLGLALRAGNLGAWEWDMQTNQVHWSPTLERIHGLEVGSFEGTFEAYQRDIHPEDRERVLTTIGDSVKEGTHRLTYRIVLPDERVRWLEASGEVVRDADGSPSRMVGVCRDITEQHRQSVREEFLSSALTTLAGSLDFESTLQEAARLAVPHIGDWCAIDLLAGSTIRRAAVYHVDPARLELAHRLRRLYPPDLEDQAGVGNVLRTAQPVWSNHIDDRLLREGTKDKTHYDLVQQLGLDGYIIAPIIRNDEMLGAITFVSESHRGFEKADLKVAMQFCSSVALALHNARLFSQQQRAIAAREQTLAVVSHDLRTPLSAISMSTELLRQRLEKDADVEHLLEVMGRSAEQMDRLISDLLDAAALDHGTLSIAVERCRADDLVRTARETVQSAMKAREVQVELNVSNTLELICDPQRIVQVLTNLLNNAISHTPSGRKVVVEAEESAPDQRFLFSVSDEGKGIKAHELDRIFTAFVQGEERATRGVGLGLHICRGIVEAHGGKIWAKSAPGRGSTFFFSLPRHAPGQLPDGSSELGVE